MAVSKMGEWFLQEAATAPGNGVGLDTKKKEAAVLHKRGGMVGTVTWEGTVDGERWETIMATLLSTGVAATTSTVAGLYRIDVRGLASVRARVSIHTSGSCTVTGRTF